MIELLAPAGSMDALRAAVQNGANAVYLGCGAFNARQSAKNFTIQSLTEAVKYCHIRGVAVHLTLNTLVSDQETPELTELIRLVDSYPESFVTVSQVNRVLGNFKHLDSSNQPEKELFDPGKKII